jgi:tetratricopeptide (TPR) repeat protein
MGMFDESILILEDIPFEEDRWHPLVVEARYNTYRDAKEWTLAMTMAKLKTESKPNNLEWLLNYADAHHQLGDTEKAIECLQKVKDQFCEEAVMNLKQMDSLSNKMEVLELPFEVNE